MRSLFLALCAVSAVWGFDPSVYTFNVTIAGFDYNYTVWWRTDTTTIYLALTCGTTGWLGFGIGEQSSGSMPGADMVVGWVSNGNGTITDRFAVEKAMPLLDYQQDWVLLASEETNGTTYLEMKRLLNTGDINDRPIVLDKPMYVVCAYGYTDTFAQHENRIATSLHFGLGYVPDVLADLRNNPNVGYFDVTQSYNLTSDLTAYIYSSKSPAGLCYDLSPNCTYLNNTFGCNATVQVPGYPPYDQRVSEACALTCGVCTQNANTTGPIYVIGMEVIVPALTAAHVHHIVLKAYDLEAGGAQVDIWATAHGSAAFRLPDACAYKFDHTAGLSTPFLQTHYDNTAQTNIGDLDTSGVRLYYQLTPRTHECGMISMGDPDVRLAYTNWTGVQNIQQTNFMCNGTCTTGLAGPLTVFGSLLHMHNTGKRIWSEQFRGGVSLGKTNWVDFWDGGFQRLVPMSYTIQPGDEFHTTCIHDTSTFVPWGIATYDEMCMEFVYYYPKIGGGVSKCGYPEAGYGAQPATCGAFLGSYQIPEDIVTSFGIARTDAPTPIPKSATNGAGALLPGIWLAALVMMM